jgi:hypothetical protein
MEMGEAKTGCVWVCNFCLVDVGLGGFTLHMATRDSEDFDGKTDIPIPP